MSDVIEEYKFRAWTKDKRMVYNVTPFQLDYCLGTDFWTCIEVYGEGFLGSGGDKARFQLNGYSIVGGSMMLCSGKKDKKGKLIYVGDVLYTKYEDEAEKSGFGENWLEITFKDGAVGWIGERTGQFYPFATDPLEHYEVIGNIYENPELKEKVTVKNRNNG